MERRTAIVIIVLIFIASAAAMVLIGRKQEPEGYRGADVIAPGIKVAAWNLQVFGPSKAGNGTLLFAYADMIRKYDIVFLQEIRDITNESFPLLCSLLIDYTCINSSRAGRTSSKEQYGIVYRNDPSIRLLGYRDFNPDPQDRWERPPLETTFGFSGENAYNMTFYLLHAKPADVARELRRLESAIANQGDVAVIGDLNADCSYYAAGEANSTEFDPWFWAIPDSADTTVSPGTDCAYDRILLNDGAKSRFREYGIDRDVTKEMTDHYLVWMRLGGQGN